MTSRRLCAVIWNPLMSCVRYVKLCIKFMVDCIRLGSCYVRLCCAVCELSTPYGVF